MPLNKQNVTINGGLITCVIPSGEETSTGIYFVANEAAAPTDDLTQIQGIGTNGSADEMIELRLFSPTQIWTLRHNVGLGINLIYGLDFTPVTARDYIVLRGIGTNTLMEFLRVHFA